MEYRLDKNNVPVVLYEILFFRSTYNCSKRKRSMCAMYSQWLRKNNYA